MVCSMGLSRQIANRYSARLGLVPILMVGSAERHNLYRRIPPLCNVPKLFAVIFLSRKVIKKSDKKLLVSTLSTTNGSIVARKH